MTLTLELTPSSDARPGDKTRHVFGEQGGTIGRAGTSSWVLSDKKISGLHALITFRNGVFYIQDKSRNGVSVNSPDNRLVQDRPYALKTGDRLLIDPYDMGVWIEGASEQPAHQSFGDPFAPADDDFLAVRPESPLPGLRSLTEPAVNDEVDPLQFFDPVGGRAPRKAEPIVPPLDDLLGAHYEPPAMLPGPTSTKPEPVGIPQGYDPLAPDDPFVEPVPPPPLPTPPLPPAIRPHPGLDAPPARRKAKDSSSSDLPTVRQPLPPPPSPPPGGTPVRPPSPAIARPPAVPRPAASAPRVPGQSADLAELLAGAGVPDGVVTPEMTRSLGQILRIVVAGLMDVLQSRQRIKEEFQMRQTVFKPSDNNPLKFSANVEDALHNLLVKRNAAYLRPVDAFAEAFDDLRDHQLAMLAGMRVAFESMLAEFDPDRLQEEFDRQLSKASLPLMPAKMRYWDLFREKRHEMVKDPEEAFAALFGDEFRRAYEEQFRELKAQRRTRSPREPGDTPPPKT